MNFDRTFTLVGNLYISDDLTRTTEAQLSLATYGLVKTFEFEQQVSPGTVGLAIPFGAASFAEFFFARVDIPEGGDCSLILEFGSSTDPAAWSAVTNYDAGDVVSFGTVAYASLVGTNVNNQPDTSPTQWLPLTNVAVTTTQVVTVPVNGGEVWINKTNLRSAKVTSTSGCELQILGGSR